MLLQLSIILFQYGIICHKSRWSERLIVRVNLYIILNVRTYLTALLYICISKKRKHSTLGYMLLSYCTNL